MDFHKNDDKIRELLFFHKKKDPKNVYIMSKFQPIAKILCSWLEIDV